MERKVNLKDMYTNQEDAAFDCRNVIDNLSVAAVSACATASMRCRNRAASACLGERERERERQQQVTRGSLALALFSSRSDPIITRRRRGRERETVGAMRCKNSST